MKKLQKFGLGLLNEQSQSAQVMSLDDRFEITYIDLEDLHDNPRNAYLNMDGVEELADEIMKVGMMQNLVVRPREGGGYVLLAGHRRKVANTIAYAKTGKEKFHRLPCIVRDPADLVLLDNDGKQLDISDELKEELCIASTNFHQRKYTPSEMMQMMAVYKRVYGQVTEQTIDEETGKKLAVGRERDFIAQQMGVHPSDIQRMDFINKNANSDVKELFENEEISRSVAYELARQPQSVQDEILSHFGETAPTVQEIKDYLDPPLPSLPPDPEEESPEQPLKRPATPTAKKEDVAGTYRKLALTRMDQTSSLLRQLQRKNKHIAMDQQQEWESLCADALDSITAIHQFLVNME